MRPEVQPDEGLAEVSGAGVPLRKDLSLVWNSKGKELLRQNRYDDARKAFKMAIQIKPLFGEGWYNLASVDSYKGEIEDALSELRKAIEIEPGFREKAKVNRYFKKLQDNEIFKKLLG